MEHVVFYPGPDATPAFRRFASLEDAVRFVEHLRNVEGIAEVTVHALSPVPLAFRTYFKVEVPAQAPAADTPVAEQPAEPVAEPVVQAVVEVPEQAVEPVGEPVEVPAVAGGKRSLGFFAH